MYNPNNEADKISNLSKALDQLASKGCKNQLIIGDYNTSLNPELAYVDLVVDFQLMFVYDFIPLVGCGGPSGAGN